MEPKDGKRKNKEPNDRLEPPKKPVFRWSHLLRDFRLSSSLVGGTRNTRNGVRTSVTHSVRPFTTSLSFLFLRPPTPTLASIAIVKILCHVKSLTILLNENLRHKYFVLNGVDTFCIFGPGGRPMNQRGKKKVNEKKNVGQTYTNSWGFNPIRMRSE